MTDFVECLSGQLDNEWVIKIRFFFSGQGDTGNGYDGHPLMQGGSEELDDEMASAFEEFLLETGQIDGQ